VAYSLKPARISQIIPMLLVTLRDFPRVHKPLLPNSDAVFHESSGLCGLAGQLDIDTLAAGYANGMFVFSHLGYLKWWSPRTRAVLFFDKARVEKSTRRLLRSNRFEITIDKAFDTVMRECAAPRPGQTPLTWITPRTRALFNQAFVEGYAHSVEVWSEGVLVGGLFGISVGRVFFTESQFHNVRDASKVAFAILNRHLQYWGFALNDGKNPNRYLMDAGMICISRSELRDILEYQCALPPDSNAWKLNADLLNGDWEPEQAPGQKMSELLK
jgi:leucyl/phenylalanyl-tRNA--protein transferase